MFVDEINAQIEKQSVYEFFLTVLEDGYYVKAGTKRFIQPCMWLFVGTDSLEDIEKDVKGSDFTSRLSLDSIDMNGVPGEQEGALYLENIYVGMLIARAEFPLLSHVHRDVVAVLGAFGERMSGNNRVSINASNREIRRIIARELRVDGAGRGTWKDGVEQIRERYRDRIEQHRLGQNNKTLKGLETEWIRIYDTHPISDPK